MTRSWEKKSSAAMAVKKEDSRTRLARRLNIPRASLYYKPILPTKDLRLKAGIEKVMAVHKAYGHRRIAIALKINKKRALRVMKLFNLKPIRKRRKPRKPKDLNQASMAIPNLIAGMIVNDKNQIWASDFTYLPYFGKFIYVATVEDVFSRQVVGWNMSMRHDTNLIAGALINAIENQRYLSPRIIHSDQGSEYRHKEYLNLLKALGISPSMSKKASPWENGYQESFYSGFKLELGHPEIYSSLGELTEAIAYQIYYYNHERIHLALKCPPAVFIERCQFKEKKSFLIK